MNWFRFTESSQGIEEDANSTYIIFPNPANDVVSQLLTTAYLNTDGKIAVVVMNQSDKKNPYRLWMAAQAAEITSFPHSIQTLEVE